MTLHQPDDISFRLIVDRSEVEKAIHSEKTFIFDNTKLTAINTCPTWGIVKYGLHKAISPQGLSREMPLEAGAACHKYFCAMRIWQLWKLQNDEEAARHVALREFGVARTDEMFSIRQDSDPFTNAINFCLPALHNSGFYDDPYDRRRTVSNLETTCITYTSDVLSNPIPVLVVRDDNGKLVFVGAEIPFAIEIKVPSIDLDMVFIGRIDGIHVENGEWIVIENKTGATLNDAWRMSYAIAHQISGYVFAGSLMRFHYIGASHKNPFPKAIVSGSQIPVPKDAALGIVNERVERNGDDINRWMEWIIHTVSIYKAHINNPTSAPRYTHSCNRYFRACSLIPFCQAQRSEQQEMLDMMHTHVWSPLDEDGVANG